MIDVVHQINAVRRHVGSRAFEAGEARTTTIGQVYDAGLDEVWDACTNPERIPRWFLPVSGGLRLHGRYQLEGNAGGTIEQCDPPNGFTATWEYGGEVSWIEVRFRPEPDGRTDALRARAHRPCRRRALGRVRSRGHGRRLGPQPHGTDAPPGLGAGNGPRGGGEVERL